MVKKNHQSIMAFQEIPVHFYKENIRLYGIIHYPEFVKYRNTAFLIVIGGHQTRVGSHRLYLKLARFISSNGIIVLRFDYEGLGDSEGDFVGYAGAIPSINSAIEYLKKEVQIEKIVIWTICNGADPVLNVSIENENEIAGLIMCNPYFIKAMDGIPEIFNFNNRKSFFYQRFWKTLANSNFDVKKIAKKLSVKSSLINTKKKIKKNNNSIDNHSPLQLQELIENIQSQDFPIRVLISERDMIAMKFFSAFRKMKKQQFSNKNNVTLDLLKKSNHTFSEPEMMNKLFTKTLENINLFLNSA
jgi:alpha/beta superfamily hydrolase